MFGFQPVAEGIALAWTSSKAGSPCACIWWVPVSLDILGSAAYCKLPQCILPLVLCPGARATCEDAGVSCGTWVVLCILCLALLGFWIG